MDFKWTGSEISFVDQPDVKKIGNITIGRFGGCSTAGQFKNEDACLIWKNDKANWEFAVLLDAHNTAQSAEIVLVQIETHKKELKQLLDQPLSRDFFKEMEVMLIGLLQQETFREVCRNVQGETACLIVVRKEKYVGWLSVGDCLAYLFHPELESLGQYQLNQRQFYEWIGQVNTFDQEVPCYSSGTRELRQGDNRLFLTTDGLVECPEGPYGEPFNIMQELYGDNGIETMLMTIQKKEVRDSTTIISWEIRIDETAALPSNHFMSTDENTRS